MVFTDDRRREVRVIYEPDGEPLYCASDIAICMGYAAPYKLVSRADVGPKYRRFIPWVSKTRRGRSETICLNRDGVEDLIDRLALEDDVGDWMRDEVFPQAEAIGRQRGYEYEKPEPEAVEVTGVTGRALGLAERLDNIILEAIMLKQEIQKMA